MDTASLDNRVALVSGASRGIGYAIACELARRGAIVVGTSTTPAGVEATDALLKQINPQCAARLLDVSDAAQCAEVMDSVVQTHSRLDILVNNAGVSRDRLALRTTEEDWSAVIETNLSSVFRLARLALRPMMKARYGRIINITSVLASTGNVGQANYAAAKAGVEGMSRSLAREIAQRAITVNCVAPGFIVTDMTDQIPAMHREQLKAQIPLGRFGQVEEVAYAVAFLASAQAAYITGSTLHINGGLYMG
jgi:3-oxoacyl-[acyl-carrier protein] reductase